MTTNERLDRLERSVAQIATALDKCVGWRPWNNYQPEFAEILQEQQHIIAEQKAKEVPA